MSDSKGKRPSTNKEDAEPEIPASTAEPSLLSRVAASASGLTRSAFASPSGVNESATATLSNAGKGQSSSGTQGEGSWAESSRFVQSAGHSQESGSSGVRAGQSKAHVRQSENEFSEFLDGIDSFTPSEDAGFANGEVPVAFEQAWTHSPPSQPNPNATLAAKTVAEQERRDGEDVLTLLSGPTALDEQFEAPEEDEEQHDWGLSQDQIIELRAMTMDLFPKSEQHVGVAAENPLNLIPISDEYDKQQWFEQWDGVLNRYADEVWGGLLPLVKEARQELEDSRNGEKAVEKSKALRRLNAILGHIQKR